MLERSTSGEIGKGLTKLAEIPPAATMAPSMLEPPRTPPGTQSGSWRHIPTHHDTHVAPGSSVLPLAVQRDQLDPATSFSYKADHDRQPDILPAALDSQPLRGISQFDPAAIALQRSEVKAPAPEPSVQRFELPSSISELLGADRSKKSPDIAEPPGADELDTSYVETLAGRIYPHISHQLKTELRRDRERAGMITGLHR